MKDNAKLQKCFIVVYKEHFPTWNTLYMAFKFLGVCKFCGILHDKDIKDDGTPKKEHYHLILYFRTYHQVKYLSDLFNTPVDEIFPLNEFKAIPYLIHMYDTDKFQYDRYDIKSSGINLDTFLNSDFNCQTTLDELIDYVLKNGIYLTSDIIDSLYTDKLINLLDYYIKHQKMCDYTIKTLYLKKGIDISRL